MPGGQKGHQLIAQFAVTHLPTVVVGGAHEHGQHVGAFGQARIGAPVGDLGIQQPIRFLEAALHVPPGTVPQKPRTVDGHRRPRPQVQHPRHDLTQSGQPRRIAGTDDGPQNDLEGDLGHLGAGRKLGTHRPTGDIGSGGLGHDRGLTADGVTGERRHHEAASIAVDVVIHDEHRGVSE